MSLKGKKILIGISGCIAAYKICIVIRLLVKAGAEVKVILTKSGSQFVTKTTLETLSNNPVGTDLFSQDQFLSTHHISYAEWADLILLAPATGNLVGKISAGIADDLLTTIVMAQQSDVIIAPAMNTEMYLNPIVQRNIEKLKNLNYLFIEPTEGDLACETSGVGRLAEPQEIFAEIENYFASSCDLAGKKIIVTAGPTIEKIDPVRYISNFSSGKMGYAIARAAQARGAEVCLISGPTALDTPKGVKLVSINSASELQKAVEKEFSKTHVLVMTAAVADFRPTKFSKSKIPHPIPKEIKLTANPDILTGLGKKKKKNQMIIGFALEVGSAKKNALKKLKNKNLDLIVMNDPTVKGAEFGGDYNIATIFTAEGKETKLKKITKLSLANKILDHIN